MQNQFCRYLSNSLSLVIDHPMMARPCCYLDGGTIIKSSADFATHFDRMSKITNYESANGQCNQCQRRETLGFRSSMRQQSFDRVSADAENKLTNLELSIDNSCNAACIMCSDSLSTQWATQNAKFNKQYKLVDKSSYTQTAINLLAQLDLSYLTYVKILGGEPFYSDTHKQILKNIPNYQNLVIQYVTNGSIFPDADTIKIWENCKKINIVFSIDDIGSRYEYIRWPLQWHQVEENIGKFLELKNINFNFSVNVTLNPLNVYYLDQTENKIKEIFKDYNYNEFEKFCRVDIADYTKVSLIHTPELLKDACYKKYGINHRVSKMLSGIASVEYTKMINWLNDLDLQRNQTSWREVFKEVAEYYI